MHGKSQFTSLLMIICFNSIGLEIFFSLKINVRTLYDHKSMIFCFKTKQNRQNATEKNGVLDWNWTLDPHVKIFPALVLSRTMRQLAWQMFIFSFERYSYTVTQRFNTSKGKNTISDVFTRHSYSRSVT